MLCLSMAIAAPGWVPARGTTLPALPANGWRQARIAEDVWDYQTAIDSRGRLLVGIRYQTGEVEIRRWDGRPGERRWEDLGGPPMPIGSRTAMGLSTEPDDTVLVALEHVDGIAVHRLPSWEVAWRPPPIGREVNAIAVDGPSRTVLVHGEDDRYRREMVASRESKPWRDLGEVGYVVDQWGPTSGRVTWMGLVSNSTGGQQTTWPKPDEVFRGDHFLIQTEEGPRWRVNSGSGFHSLIAGGGGEELSGHSRATFTNMHYEGEANRVHVVAETGVLAGPGETSLALPDTFRPRVFETDPPLLTFNTYEGLYVAEWNGEEWWGLDHEPIDDRGLGALDDVAEWVELHSPKHVETFVADESRGHTLIEFTRERRRWTSSASVPPAAGVEHGADPWCSAPSMPLWRARQTPGDIVAMEPMCDGTFDRINGSGVESWGLERRGAELVPLPAPQCADCTDRQAQLWFASVPRCSDCAFERGVRASDGSLLASFLHGEAGPQIFRLVEGHWEKEVLPPGVVGRQVAAMVRRGDSVWVAFVAKSRPIVARWKEQSWTVLEDSNPIPRPESGGYGWNRARAEQLEVAADGAVHLLRADVGQTFLEHWIHTCDGWRRETVAEVSTYIRPRARLGLTTKGVPVVAFLDPDGVRVLARGEGGWRGLDGSVEGRAWSGRTAAVDLTVDRKGRACIAFTAADVRYRRVGVLCYR